MIEILVVVGIIALLTGMLVPALNMVRKSAKDVKQKAQFTAIELGLAAFKSDYGDYPPSSWWNPAVPNSPQNYCGAQKLAEAMLGWDLLGFHPDSAWRADGLDAANGPGTYNPNPQGPGAVSLERRRDRYIDMDAANVFRLGVVPGQWDGLFGDSSPLAANTYVLCDVFTIPERRIQRSDGKMVSPGTPILYYRANPASKMMNWTDADGPERSIYCARDNVPLVNLGRVADGVKPLPMRRRHRWDSTLVNLDVFYNFIRDPKVDARFWPQRPDSYILISAGADGLYGTDDDICNFGR